MDQRLRQALDVVLVDLRGSGVPVPEVVEGDWSDDEQLATAYLSNEGGSSEGIRVMIDAAEADRIVEVADQVQEWVIGELWPRRPTNWPRCPEHPDGHPLSASTAAGVASWVCPSSSARFASIGALDEAKW